MPISVNNGKEFIKEWVQNQDDIKHIVDVGIGSGTYRKLLKDKWKWTGIEIWSPYISFFKLDTMYDNIIIGDIRHTIIPECDLIIFGDVLEHMKKHQARSVLDRVKSHVIISIPQGQENGREFLGNPFEAHESAWSAEELDVLAKDFDIHKVFEDGNYINPIHILIR